MIPKNPYAPFDTWLNTPTWHTPHGHDLRRFHRALHSAADEPITAEGLRHYIMDNTWGEKLGWPLADKSAACERYVAKAEAVLEHYQLAGAAWPRQGVSK